MGRSRRRPWWDRWLEYMIIAAGVIGLSPFLITLFFALGCWGMADSNSCWVLSQYQQLPQPLQNDGAAR